MVDLQPFLSIIIDERVIVIGDGMHAFIFHRSDRLNKTKQKIRKKRKQKKKKTGEKKVTGWIWLIFNVT